MKNKSLKKVCGIAIFSSLAFVVSLIFRFPVMFLTFDAKDAVITIAAFVYGPVSAILMAVIAAFLELITVSDTGVYGFIMNIASSVAFGFSASLIYKYKRTYLGSVFGLVSAIIVTVSVMMLMNYFVTPFYMGTTTEEVVKLLPTVLLPFNFAKASLNAAVVMLLYKPTSVALRRVGLSISSGASAATSGRKMIISVAISLLLAASSVAIFLILKF